MKSSAINSRLLIIGYGNALRADDGAGCFIAETLEKRLPSDQADVLVSHQLFPEMAETISRAQAVIFIDAAVDVAAGEFTCKSLESDAPGNAPMTHHLKPETLLVAARELYGRCPPATLYSIGAASFDHGDALTPAVRRVCQQVINAIANPASTNSDSAPPKARIRGAHHA